MIKAVIFDIGGVYLRGGIEGFIGDANKVLGIDFSYDKKQETIFDEILLASKSLRECFSDFFGVKIPSREMQTLENVWKNNWKPDEDMVKLADKLKNRYKLAILSNSEKSLADICHKRGWYSFAAVVVLSHEVGYIKPQKEIYRIAVDRIGFRPDECLFIDDQEINLAPAKQMGMKTVLFESSPQLEKELAGLGIKTE